MKAEITRDLQAQGWQLVPSDGKATVFATDKVKNEQELGTMYDGFGGGWGWGGWGGWGGGYGMGGFGGDGDSTVTTVTQRVGHFVVDIFDASSHKLLFRGVANNDLSNDSSKNSKGVKKDVDNMLNKLPSDSKGLKSAFRHETTATINGVWSRVSNSSSTQLRWAHGFVNTGHRSY